MVQCGQSGAPMNKNRERLALNYYKRPKKRLAWYRRDRLEPDGAISPETYTCDVGKDDRYLERLKANHPERIKA